MNGEPRSVSIAEFVSEVVGHRDKTLEDLIRRQLKPKKESSESGGGYRSIPEKYWYKEEKYLIRLCPESRLYFENFFVVSAIFRPKEVAKILKREHLEDLEDFKRTIRVRKDEKNALFKIFGKLINHWDEIQKKILSSDFDLSRASLLPEDEVEFSPAALYAASELASQRKRQPGNTVPEAVQSALRLSALGKYRAAEYELMGHLKKYPDSPYAHYGLAVCELSRANAAANRAKYFHVLKECAEIRHEDMWEDVAGEEEGRAHDSQRKALYRLVKALHHWPQGEREQLFDWGTYENVLRLIVHLAARFASSHHLGGCLSDFGYISDRIAGKIPSHIDGRESFFGEERDAMVLEAMKAAEERSWGSSHENRFLFRTQLLQVYRVLSPEDYERYLSVWRAELEKSFYSSVLPHLHPLGWGKIIRDHLQQALSAEERTAWITKLKDDQIRDIERRTQESIEFVNTTPEDERQAELDDPYWNYV